MHQKITTVFGRKTVKIQETEKQITPFGGLAILGQFFDRIGLATVCERYMPFRLTSPNAIPAEQTFIAFLLSVIAGARRFSHANLVRADKALHQLFGFKRFPTDDTIRNWLKRFDQAKVNAFFGNLTRWHVGRLLKAHPGPLTLDLDSTVFERYGNQEGATKGYNPRRPGRKSHHPILACLAEIPFILNGWMRPGHASAAWAAHEFLEASLGLLPEPGRVKLVRADSGFFQDLFLSYLEKWGLDYIVVARFTRNIHLELRGVSCWRDLDETYSAASFHRSLCGWTQARRFVVIRELKKPGKEAAGRMLFEIPEYTFRVFVTNRNQDPEEIWRTYNGRAVIEKRINELKADLAIDGFCMKHFFATEAAFRSILCLFNLLVEFQEAIKLPKYCQPATLRMKVFLCGAALGKRGGRLLLRLSKAWGGLTSRSGYLDNLLTTYPELLRS